MGKVGDDGPVHLEVDLDGGAAQLGMRRGAGVGVGKAADPGDIAGEFDDSLVVDVVQHGSRPRASRGRLTALGGGALESYIWWQTAEIQSGHVPAGGRNGSQFGRGGVRIVGLRRPAANRPVCR